MGKDVMIKPTWNSYRKCQHQYPKLLIKYHTCSYFSVECYLQHICLSLWITQIRINFLLTHNHIWKNKIFHSVKNCAWFKCLQLENLADSKYTQCQSSNRMHCNICPVLYRRRTLDIYIWNESETPLCILRSKHRFSETIKNHQ